MQRDNFSIGPNCFLDAINLAQTNLFNLGEYCAQLTSNQAHMHCLIGFPDGISVFGMRCGNFPTCIVEPIKASSMVDLVPGDSYQLMCPDWWRIESDVLKEPAGFKGSSIFETSSFHKLDTITYFADVLNAFCTAA